MRILVTGGCGYIGSHVVNALLESGHEIVVLDHLREGHRGAVDASAVRIIEGDIADPQSVDEAIGDRPLDGVIHMAALCLVGESMRQPELYYDNNVVKTLRLLDLLGTRGVGRFVFSSTAAVYGDPVAGAGDSIDEDHRCLPTNVYGETKLVVERALSWYARRGDWKAISLRYFNAAGADASGRFGEDHDPETHLIPLICKAALGTIDHLQILGRDYPTPDGTCLRDYIHVSDLAAAHVLALEALAPESGRGELAVYNMGAETAVSVLEMIKAAGRVIGRPIPVEDAPRRPGDPPVLRASSARIRKDLGWKPTTSDLDTILRTAWRWHERCPGGFEGPALP